MRLLDLNRDLLIHDLLVRGEGENSLPGASSTVALCMCHTILKTEAIKEEKKPFIILLMDIISGGHDIGWVCEIPESMFVFM